MDDQNPASALSPEQRRQLLQLITSIIEQMRNRTISYFEVDDQEPKETEQGRSPVQNDDLPKELDTAPSFRKDEQDRSESDPDTSVPKEKDLGAAAVGFFDDWQSKIRHRVRETLEAKVPESKLNNDRSVDSRPKHQADPAPLSSSTTSPNLSIHYRPISTRLSALPLPERISILQLTLLLLLSLTTYPPHSRILLLYLSISLSLPDTALPELETATAQTLLSPESQSQPLKATAPNQGSSSSKWKIGLATISGAALIGITGGLATPLVAAGVGGLVSTLGLGGTVVAGYLGALAGSGVVVGGIFGAYGGRVTGRMAQEYTKEVEEFGILPLRRTEETDDSESNTDEDEEYKDDDNKNNKTNKTPEQDEADKRLTVTICISGLLHSHPRDLHHPWLSLSPPTSSHSSLSTLRFSPSTLLSLTSTISSFPTSYATTLISSEVLKRTALAPLIAATWPLSFLKFGKILDNPFSLARVRADKAGLVLADALVRERVQGNRPVRLIGFSMGARVVLACCRELARRAASSASSAGEEGSGVGIVEDVILMGAPASSSAEVWKEVRGVVQGRVVNVYSKGDWVLGVLEKVGTLGGGVAGTEEVRGVKGVENLDVSELVSGHSGWIRVVGRVLKRCGWVGLDEERVREEEKEGKEIEREEMEERKEVVESRTADGGEGLKEVDEWLNKNKNSNPIKDDTITR